MRGTAARGGGVDDEFGVRGSAEEEVLQEGGFAREAVGELVGDEVEEDGGVGAGREVCWCWWSGGCGEGEEGG